MDFTAVPNSLTVGQLSISLLEASVSDLNGVENEAVDHQIDFRPHRTSEGKSGSFGGELDEGTGNQAFDSSNSFDPSWTPASNPSNNLIWLDANDASTIIESGGTVSAWNDKSSSGNHLSPHDLSDPVTGLESLNGLNVITFDGDDILTRDTTSNINDEDQTWFILAKVPVGGVSSNGDAIMAYDRWIDGNWQIQANNASQFRGRVMKNITGTWVATSVYSSEDLSGEYHLYCLELDRSNLTLSNWLDGSLNDYEVSDPLPIRENERFSLMGNPGATDPRLGCRSYCHFFSFGN